MHAVNTGTGWYLQPGLTMCGTPPCEEGCTRLQPVSVDREAEWSMSADTVHSKEDSPFLRST